MEERPTLPRGLKFQADFITPSHEAELLHIFRHELAWPEAKKPGARLSLHYGYTFDYKTFGVDPAIPYKPFPAWLRPLIPRLAGDEEEATRDPEQVCLQHYPPGAGIPPHVDTHSAYHQLFALSLGSPVVMQFRRAKPQVNSVNENENGGKDGEGGEREERETVEVDLAPRSMMEMSGDARLHWEHGIKKRKKDVLADGAVRAREDRWSITYRWLRAGGECECGDERLCDTAQRRRGVEREYRWKQQQAQPQQQTGEQQNGAEDHVVQVSGNGESNGGCNPEVAPTESIDVDHHGHEKGNIPLSTP
ncbi:hypothetical protein F4825DRAFT_427907 [Nemania diffusa]|nr:hypothetical protein F4825DRAFT_427907 [Nemania diffusa]